MTSPVIESAQSVPAEPKFQHWRNGGRGTGEEAGYWLHLKLCRLNIKHYLRWACWVSVWPGRCNRWNRGAAAIHDRPSQWFAFWHNPFTEPQRRPSIKTSVGVSEVSFSELKMLLQGPENFSLWPLELIYFFHTHRIHPPPPSPYRSADRRTPRYTHLPTSTRTPLTPRSSSVYTSHLLQIPPPPPLAVRFFPLNPSSHLPRNFPWPLGLFLYTPSLPPRLA